MKTLPKITIFRVANFKKKRKKKKKKKKKSKEKKFPAFRDSLHY